MAIVKTKTLGIRMEPWLHAALERAAKKENRPVSQYAATVLIQHLAERNAAATAPKPARRAG